MMSGAFITKMLAKESPCNVIAEPTEDCVKAKFTIQGIRCISATKFEVCVQASQAGTPNYWEFKLGNVTQTISQLGSVCISIEDPNLTGPPILSIMHIKDGPMGTIFCTKSFNLLCGTNCDDLEFTTEYFFCHADFTLNYPASNAVLWDFGDGSLGITPAGQNAVSHNFPTTGGDFTICQTQVIDTGQDTLDVNVCSKMISVPPCSENICDNMILEMNKTCNGSEESYVEFHIKHYQNVATYRWNFGDGTPSHTSITPDAMHTYDKSGCYNICITLYGGHGDLIATCCYRKCINCCSADDFDFYSVLPTGSCFNQKFVLENHCGKGSNLKHIWEFEDGKVYYGENPPAEYVFSNFVNEDHEVCVRHTIICCKDTITATKCLPFTKGVFVGYAGKTTKATDFASWWGHPAIRIYQMIDQYSNVPGLPLFMDGTYHHDLSHTYPSGTWNMGYSAVIYVNSDAIIKYKPESNPNAPITFGLEGTVIQDAKRFHPQYGTCCRWEGIRNNGPNRFEWDAAQITDAKKMLDLSTNAIYNNELAVLKIEDCRFYENIYGIYSKGFSFTVPSFSNNVYDGPHHPHETCDCDVEDAIHLENISSPPVVFPNNKTTDNEILVYQNGLFAKNSNVKFYSFNIHDQATYALLDKDNIGNGIYYETNKGLNYSLTCDYIKVKDFKAGITQRSVGLGTQSLMAIADVPYSSIWFENVTKGIDIDATNVMLNTRVLGTKIITNGGVDNLGIVVKLNGVVTNNSNMVQIDNNDIYCNGGLGTKVGIGILNNNLNKQYFSVSRNRVSHNYDLGVGVIVSNGRNSNINSNSIDVKNTSSNGLEIINSDFSKISCNTFEGGEMGVRWVNSKYALLSQNFTGDNKIGWSIEGACDSSKIEWNRFDYTKSYSLQYNSSIAGKQSHRRYNSWTSQNGKEISAVYPLQNQMWCDGSQTVGTVHRPLSDAAGDFFNATVYTYLSPQDSCPVLQNHDNGDNLDGEGVLQNCINRINDTLSLAGYTDVQRCNTEQSLFQSIRENPAWMVSSTVISQFAGQHISDFVDKSVAVQMMMSQVQAEADTLQSYLSTYLVVFDSLQEIRAQLIEDLNTAPDSVTYAAISEQLSENDTLLTELRGYIDNLNVQNASVISAMLGAIESLNASISVSGLHEYCEKNVNQYYLKAWRGDSLSSGEKDDLWDIANTCYEDGGKVVDQARALWLQLYDQYLMPAECVESRATSNDSYDEKMEDIKGIHTISLYPNPTADVLNIVLKAEDDVMAEFRIFDIRGHEMPQHFKRSINSLQLILDVKSFAEGMYYVRLNIEGKSISRKFLVLRR